VAEALYKAEAANAEAGAAAAGAPGAEAPSDDDGDVIDAEFTEEKPD